MDLVLFLKAPERTKKNIYTPIFQTSEQAAVNDSFTKGDDELLDDKIYRLTES